MEAETTAHFVPYVVIFNFTMVGLILIVVGRILGRGQLTDGVPEGRQNLAEFILDFFVGKAREMGDTRVVKTVAPFLATCFLFILVSNTVGFAPVPILNHPPTAYFSVTLALALCAVAGTLIISGVFNGLLGAVKHLFWPNPLQFISEVTDVLSLSLRLFGNIGGEYMTVVLVTQSVAIGIPLILHVLGLIPTFVQALVFTLLTTSFIAGVVHHEEAKEEAPRGETQAPEKARRRSIKRPAIEGEPAESAAFASSATPGVEAGAGAS